LGRRKGRVFLHMEEAVSLNSDWDTWTAHCRQRRCL
jgi:hypothetical protein